MKVVFVQPLRLQYYMNRIYREFELDDVPETVDILEVVFRREIQKSVDDMSPVFIDLIQLLLETLSSYGVELDFFSVAEVQAVDECKSLLIKVL